MKKEYITTLICTLVMIAVVGALRYKNIQKVSSEESLKVGFLYVNDESNPYTANFIKAQREVENTYGDQVDIHVKDNVPEDEESVKSALESLIDDGCKIIFSTSYGYGVYAKEVASDHPDVQICQATAGNANEEPVVENYHCFMGHIYQGRYVAGVVAGLKIKELIDNGTISKSQAKIGYVGAFPYAEVISGYTAFFLGVRSVVSDATMEVKYTNTWSDYALEKSIAEELIDDGCIVISQHSDTMGPAQACQDAVDNDNEKIVYHVGYNDNMIDKAPTTSLVSSRINWNPYIVSAVGAVIDDKKIEKVVDADINGNDAGAGFDKGWVELMELNSGIVAEGTEETTDKIIKQLNADKIGVFSGDYKGVDPFDSTDTINLNEPFIENETQSAPSFHYVLRDVIKVIED